MTTEKSLVTGLPKATQRQIDIPAAPGQTALRPDNLHADFSDYSKIWKRCRDAAIGQRAIRAAGVEYLPQLYGQTPVAYQAYRDRANFFGATGRTIESMTGQVFRRPAIQNLPATIKEWADNITLDGETLTDFAQLSVSETLEVGRGGIFVDFPRATPGVISVAQAEAVNQRPYLVFFKAESIINWETKRINNVVQLYNVWIKEEIQLDGEKVTQVRQLSLETGFYQQKIFKLGATGYYLDETITPTKGAVAFTEIPFYPLSAKNTRIDLSDAPLESLVDVNISHYQNSADLENGAHISGVPTLVVTGYQEEKNAAGDVSNPIYLGSATALVMGDPNAKAFFVTVGENGFGTLEKLMAEKKAMMAQLGAQLLMPEKKAAEAAQTAEIRRGGENSVLASIASIIDRQITKALQFMADWQGIGGEISFELNKDYFPVSFTAQDLTAWVAANQSGRISDETFWEILRQSEWIPDAVTFEVEKARREESGPSLVNPPAQDEPPTPGTPPGNNSGA